MIKIRKTGKRTSVYDLHVADNHNFLANGVVVHNCTEIVEPTFSGKYSTHKGIKGTIKEGVNSTVIGVDRKTGELKTIDDAEVAVCNLGSINLSKYIKEDGKIDKAKLRKNVSLAIKFLDKVVDQNFYPVDEAMLSNHRWRPIGLGLMGWQDVLFQKRLAFESEEAIALSQEIQEEIYYTALKTSCDLSKEFGPHRDFKQTHAAKGLLQFDLSGHVPENTKRWDELKEDIKQFGLRNSLLIAIAPTATISSIAGCYECTEPQLSNLFKRETLSGEFVQLNKYLVADLKERGLWNTEMVDKIKAAEGSIQHMSEIPEELRGLYKTVWEVKQKAIIDHAIGRGHFIDQSQSTNLFMANPTIEKLSSMYFYAWDKGLKTTYYLRSKAKTRINQVAAGMEPVEDGVSTVQPEIDLENPEVCETCQ